MHTVASRTRAWEPEGQPAPSRPAPSLSAPSRLARRPLAAALALALVSAGAGCSREGDGHPPPARTPEPTARQEPGAAGSQAAAAGSQDAAGESAAPAAGAAAGKEGGAAGTPAAQRPKMNVLVISIDSLRADMPWNGYERDIAPRLTAFEKKAVSYTRHYAISSYTSMSVGGFLAGRYPSEVDRSGYFFGNYPDSVLMFPELLQKAGVRTMTAHAHFYFDQKAGFRQGFDVYEIVPGLSADNTTDRNVTSPGHLELAIEMLSDKANTSGTFFAYFHFLDPHDVYMTHEGIEPFGKRARDKYDGEVRFTDMHVGKLLDFVAQQPWGKDTAIIITADHGEAFGEHKMYRHGFEVWDVLTHVPLMIQAPGGITPRRIDVPRSSIDLAPTILDMTGAPPEPSFPGKSLVPELYGASAEPRDVIVDLPRTSDNDRRRALISGRHKLIAYGDDDAFELYDVVADPGETKDIKRDQGAVFEAMKAIYRERSAAIKDVCPKNTAKLKGKKKNKPC
ncbi:sulfatase [Sorangium sp. So ce834]|uniref:sulfatase n=1 Tax=Sorangium sp. So ce834 TaxID=3133321 RepID=UPI003F5E81E8